jgi:hypothetical protein
MRRRIVALPCILLHTRRRQVVASKAGQSTIVNRDFNRLSFDEDEWEILIISIIVLKFRVELSKYRVSVKSNFDD